MMIFRRTCSDRKKRITVLLPILNYFFQSIYRFVITAEIVHQDDVTPSFTESFRHILINRFRSMDTAGIPGRYIPVEIMVTPVMDFFREPRHDPRVVAADLVGAAAGEAGNAAPDPEFIEK